VQIATCSEQQQKIHPKDRIEFHVSTKEKLTSLQIVIGMLDVTNHCQLATHIVFSDIQYQNRDSRKKQSTPDSWFIKPL
jgi:hypothetical protein